MAREPAARFGIVPGGGPDGEARKRRAIMTRTLPDLDLSQSRVTIIMNAHSGKKDAEDRVAALRQRLGPAVKSLALRPVRSGSDIGRAAKAAVLEGSDVVAALGGDGTQSAVAGALAGTGAVMAVLPGGTFNYFARELGVETMDAAVEALLRGKVATRDLGSVNGRVFINNASFGLYPRILESREDIYRRWGRSRIAAYWSVLVGLRNLRRPMHLSVTVGDETRDFHTPLAFVARSAYQLESLGLEGAEAVRDGHFALFLAKGTSRLALIGASLRLAFGKMARGSDFDLVVSDSLLIETARPRRSVALDGEQERMTAPFRLQVLSGALRVIVPAQVAGDTPAAGRGDGGRGRA